MATSSIARPASKSEPAQKSYQKILEQEITEGLKELDRETAGLFLPGFPPVWTWDSAFSSWGS